MPWKRFPFMKGARQDASRVNRYLREAGLETVRALPPVPSEPLSATGTVHWSVQPDPVRRSRSIPQGLHAHRARQAARTTGTDRIRKQLARTPMAQIQNGDHLYLGMNQLYNFCACSGGLYMEIIDQRMLANSGASACADERRRAVLAKALMRAFDEWSLSNAERQVLLGLGGNSRTTLKRYAEGHPLANTRDLLDRAGHLLGIYKGLMLLYPENPGLRNGWMRAANRRFHGRSPVAVVQEYGLPGLVMVRAQVDRMRGH